MSNFGTIHHQDTIERYPDTRTPDPHQDTFSKTIFGFWLYLMSDCLIFASLFATYAVLHKSTFGGPSSQDIFSLPLAFAETLILLLSSITCGISVLASLKNRTKQVLIWLVISFLLGAFFIGLELHEFTHLVKEGYSWKVSAFLSSYFALVGTHGLHVSLGLLWMVVIMVQVFYSKITVHTFRRLVVFSLFWHFLDVIWIFIFTFVYLMGVN